MPGHQLLFEKKADRLKIIQEVVGKIGFSQDQAGEEGDKGYGEVQKGRGPDFMGRRNGRFHHLFSFFNATGTKRVPFLFRWTRKTLTSLGGGGVEEKKP